MKVSIVTRRGSSRAAYLVAETSEVLTRVGAEAVVDAATAEELDVGSTSVGSFDDCSLVVDTGGDEAFLYATHGADGAPILDVNLGEIGFLDVVSPADAIDEMLAEVAAFQEGDQSVREVPRIVASGDGWGVDPSVNKVVVHGPRRSHGSSADLKVRVDGSLYSGSHTDGVPVMTPTRSSAHNLSEDGPLVHPDVEGFAVTGMAVSEGMPSLAVPQGAAVNITVTGAASVAVVGGGRTRRTVPPPMEVHIKRSDLPVRSAGPASDFFEAPGKLD